MAFLDETGLAYLWSKIKTQLNGKAASSHNHDGRYLRWGGSSADTNAMGWGTLTPSNGYTIASHASSSDGGDWGMVYKGGQIFMQLDGCYYQNEGRYRVLDTSDVPNLSISLTQLRAALANACSFSIAKVKDVNHGDISWDSTYTAAPDAVSVGQGTVVRVQYHVRSTHYNYPTTVRVTTPSGGGLYIYAGQWSNKQQDGNFPAWNTNYTTSISLYPDRVGTLLAGGTASGTEVSSSTWRYDEDQGYRVRGWYSFVRIA